MLTPLIEDTSSPKVLFSVFGTTGPLLSLSISSLVFGLANLSLAVVYLRFIGGGRPVRKSSKSCWVLFISSLGGLCCMWPAIIATAQAATEKLYIQRARTRYQ